MTLKVDRDYVCNLEFEDLIFGEDLREGMIVLIAEPTMRWGGGTDMWCTVTRLRRSGDIVQFIGVYADNTARVRSYNVSHAWIVKRMSDVLDEPGRDPGEELHDGQHGWQRPPLTCSTTGRSQTTGSCSRTCLVRCWPRW